MSETPAPVGEPREIFAVCKVSDFSRTPAAGFILARVGADGKNEPLPIIIVRQGKKIYGYVNRCPHQGSRLDFEPNQFLDPEHRNLMCGKHGAQFDIPTGHGISGPCQGDRLEPIELVIDDGDVCITGIRLAEEDGLDLVDSTSPPEPMITDD